MSAVRRLQLHNNTYVFRYAAIRLLEVDIFLDRRTAETIAKFIEPLTIPRETEHDEPTIWARKLTEDMESNRCVPRRLLPGGMESTLHSANAGRIYFEQVGTTRSGRPMQLRGANIISFHSFRMCCEPAPSAPGSPQSDFYARVDGMGCWGGISDAFSVYPRNGK